MASIALILLIAIYANCANVEMTDGIDGNTFPILVIDPTEFENVSRLEEGLLDDDVTDRMIVRYLEPLLADGIDTLVLGCTHYPLLTGAITRVLSSEIMLVDSAQNCARAVEKMLDRQSLRAAPANRGELHVAFTDAADNFLNVARDALQLSFGEIELRPLP